jgi:hypothetical protein
MTVNLVGNENEDYRIMKHQTFFKIAYLMPLKKQLYNNMIYFYLKSHFLRTTVQ